MLKMLYARGLNKEKLYHGDLENLLFKILISAINITTEE